jgi:hypothetical protein
LRLMTYRVFEKRSILIRFTLSEQKEKKNCEKKFDFWGRRLPVFNMPNSWPPNFCSISKSPYVKILESTLVVERVFVNPKMVTRFNRFLICRILRPKLLVQILGWRIRHIKNWEGTPLKIKKFVYSAIFASWKPLNPACFHPLLTHSLVTNSPFAGNYNIKICSFYMYFLVIPRESSE